MSWSWKNGGREQVERVSHGKNLANVGGKWLTKIAKQHGTTIWDKQSDGAGGGWEQSAETSWTNDRNWKKTSTQRRRFKVKYDPNLLEILQQAHEKTIRISQNVCKKEKSWQKHPATTIWNVGCGFLAKARWGEVRPRKNLSNKQIPQKHRRQLKIAAAGITPTGSWLKNINKLSTEGCRLCKRAREARGESTQELPNETHGHINSAGCDGMAEAVTAARHSIWGHLCSLIGRDSVCRSWGRGFTPDRYLYITDFVSHSTLHLTSRASVAQLVRARDCQSLGRRFDSV